MLTAKAVNQASFWAADQLYPRFSQLDPDQVFLHISLHHLTQLLLTLVLMATAASLHPQIQFKEFGFNLKQLIFSLKWVLSFALVWSLIQFGIGYLLVRSGFTAPSEYPLTTRNLISIYSFQIFLSGTGEEPLYRGLIMTVMLVGWQGLYRNPRRLAAAAVLGSTLVFMVDHINFSLAPLAVTHFNLLQQLTVMIFGFFYGWLFWKTDSLSGPILAHGILIGIIITSGILLPVMIVC